MIIYKATNTVNGKYYIGKTKNSLDSRIKSHKVASTKKEWLFYRAINKHGFDKFKWEIIIECDDANKLNELEKKYIGENNNGYNVAKGGDGGDTISNHPNREILRENVSKFHKGKILSEEHIKRFHYLLKQNTSDAKKSWFKVGDYKLKANMVGGVETTLPNQVPSEMKNLIASYQSKSEINIHDVIDFHFQFEKIHPFQDGNGRVGRLVIFKECLANGIIPLIIEDEYKFFYYRGLTEYPKVKEYLIDTCLSAQDAYKKMVDYFLTE